MSLTLTLEGQSGLQAQLQRLAQQTADLMGDLLEARTEIEVRSRETVGGRRKPLTITRADVLEMHVAWPYPHKGGEGTYVWRIVSEVGSLLPDSLGHDIGQALEHAAKR